MKVSKYLILSLHVSAHSVMLSLLLQTHHLYYNTMAHRGWSVQDLGVVCLFVTLLVNTGKCTPVSTLMSVRNSLFLNIGKFLIGFCQYNTLKIIIGILESEGSSFGSALK